MKINRLFGILYLLLSKRTMTAKELADYFEVSIRTIYRDIESLSELHIPIYMSQGKNGGISLLDHYKFDKTLLTDEEQNQILFSLQGINTLQIDNDDIYNKMKHLFSKDDHSWFDVDFSTWSDSKTHKKHFETIKYAIINKHKIQFDYFNSRGVHTTRLIEPLQLYFKYNSWYLYGYDDAKQDNRLFKIMRMKDVILLDETFSRTILKKDTLFEETSEKITLILLIDKKMSYRVYDEFEEPLIKILENGDFLIEKEFSLNDWLYGYLLSFGNYLTVIKPDMIREKMLDIIEKSLKNYL